jgi:hypothetical protein
MDKKDFLNMLKTFALIEFIPGSMCFHIISLQKRVDWLEAEQVLGEALKDIEWV